MVIYRKMSSKFFTWSRC